MYRIGELAGEANVSKRTIDYYTQVGLLAPLRSRSNYRLYDERSVKALKLISHYKELNMSLQDIKVILNEGIDETKLEKHVHIISELIDHLEHEIKGIKPVIEQLNDKEKEMVVHHITPKSIALAQALLLAFN